MPYKSSMIAVAALAVALLHAPDARADARQDIESQLHEDMWRLTEARVAELEEYGECRAMLKKAKKLKASTRFKSFNFEKHPNAKQVDGEWTITVADIPWICDAIDRVIARGTLWTALQDAKGREAQLAANPPLDENANIDAGKYYLDLAKTCALSVAENVEAGDAEIDFQGESIPMADAERLCGVLTKWGEYMNASGEANFEKVAPKYRELGVDGDRLRLFVQYDGVYFRGKKCAILEELPALAKAKYVYQWLENPDGTHTIRKYTFKKNKYKVSEKKYLTEKKAYKGCK